MAKNKKKKTVSKPTNALGPTPPTEIKRDDVEEFHAVGKRKSLEEVLREVC